MNICGQIFTLGVYIFCGWFIYIIGEPACSRQHFFRMWRDEWPNATCQRWNKFTKCRKCVGFDTVAAQSKDTGKSKCVGISYIRVDILAGIHVLRAKHEDEWKRERTEYYYHLDLARTYPKKCEHVTVSFFQSSIGMVA